MGSINPTVPTTTSGNGTGLTVKLNVSWDSYYNWDASWSIVETGTGYQVGDTITIARPFDLPTVTNSSGNYKVFPNGAPNISVTGIKEDTRKAIEGNLNWLDAIADYVQMPGMEHKSHQEGPEHECVYINELINPGSGKASYMDLAIGGIRINSAKEWTTFTQLSAYFKKGIKVTDLASTEAWDSNTSYTVDSNLASLFRTIFYKGKSYRCLKAPNVNKKPD
jgi:hypothetical protein